jgi:excisionase family DNA binding protein
MANRTKADGARILSEAVTPALDRPPNPRAFGLVKAAYSVNQTLDLLSIGRTTFYELVDRGDIKVTKLGRKTLVYAIDLAALLNKLRSRN